MMSRSAFTLVEVLVAVMLISILLTGIFKVSDQQTKIIAHALENSKISEKVSLFIDTLKPKKEKKKIELNSYLQNLKINSNAKRKLNDTFIYNSFLNETLQKNTHKKEKKDQNMEFKIYKQIFRNKNGYSVSYYRIIRE